MAGGTDAILLGGFEGKSHQCHRDSCDFSSTWQIPALRRTSACLIAALGAPTFRGYKKLNAGACRNSDTAVLHGLALLQRGQLDGLIRFARLPT